MDGIMWEEPPNAQRGWRHHQWEPLLAQLTEHPGRWAKLAEMGSVNSAASSASRLRRIHNGFEFTSSKTWVYARFVGTTDER